MHAKRAQQLRSFFSCATNWSFFFSSVFTIYQQRSTITTKHLPSVSIPFFLVIMSLLQRISKSRPVVSKAHQAGQRFLPGSYRTGSFHRQASSFSQYASMNSGNQRLFQIGAFGLTMMAGQYTLGSASNFFDEKFVVQGKSSEDLADFYGTEDFMEIFCVFPFMVDLMIRGAEFDDDGTIHAWGLLGPGELEVSVLFEEREDESTDGDGEPDTLVWFNKKESFCDHAPTWLGGFKLWEMTQNFGYRRYEDGTVVVSHQGEHFKGFFPIRLLFQLHAKYVAWATEKYLNGPYFGVKDSEDQMEEQRHNIPLHVMKKFLSGLKDDIQHVRAGVQPNSERARELDVTIRRLNTLSNDIESGRVNLPRLRTLRSRATQIQHVHLVMEDDETKKTIQAAVQQLEDVPTGTTTTSSSSGISEHRQTPTKKMMELTRHTLMESTGDNDR